MTERDRRGIQRPAHAVGTAGQSADVGGEGRYDPLLRRPLRHLHDRPRGVRADAVRPSARARVPRPHRVLPRRAGGRHLARCVGPRASHAVSFAFNYIGGGEYRTAALASLMSRPYGRVMVLHVVIMEGGFLVQGLGAPLAAIALLVVLKTGLDLVGHVREHAVP